jgi:hypothetical protein
LITCNEFLKRYRDEVINLPGIKCPLSIWKLFAFLIKWGNSITGGRFLPPMNPYLQGRINLETGSVDNSKAIYLLGWSQSISTEVGLRNHFNYYRNFRNKIN